MKISSITSLYKSEKFIKNFVRQFEDQSIFKDVEIIIIDCNEDDKDRKFLGDFINHPNVYYEKLDSDPGLYGAWNKALEHVTTDYITNSNTDDVKAPWYFELMYNYMKTHPECDVAYGPVGETRYPAKPFYEDFCKKTWQCLETNFSTIIVENSPHCMPTWKSSLHKEVGNFDTNYAIRSDFEFWVRCLTHNKRFDKLNFLMGNYYFNEEGVSLSDFERVGVENATIIKKYYKNQPAAVFDFYNSLIQKTH